MNNNTSPRERVNVYKKVWKKIDIPLDFDADDLCRSASVGKRTSEKRPMAV